MRWRGSAALALKPVLTALLPVVLPAAAPAAVCSVSDAGAVIELTATIAVPQAAAWAVLIAPARWWSGKDGWSGDARNLTLAARGLKAVAEGRDPDAAVPARDGAASPK